MLLLNGSLQINITPNSLRLFIMDGGAAALRLSKNPAFLFKAISVSIWSEISTYQAVS